MKLIALLLTVVAFGSTCAKTNAEVTQDASVLADIETVLAANQQLARCARSNRNKALSSSMDAEPYANAAKIAIGHLRTPRQLAMFAASCRTLLKPMEAGGASVDNFFEAAFWLALKQIAKLEDQEKSAALGDLMGRIPELRGADLSRYKAIVSPGYGEGTGEGFGGGDFGSNRLKFVPNEGLTQYSSDENNNPTPAH